MRNKSWLSGAILLLLASMYVGCGGSKPTTPTPPPPPPPPPVVTLPTTFTGNVTSAGPAVYSFSVAAGAITARLASVTGAASIGVAVGSYSGSTCTPFISNDGLAAGASVNATMVSSGTGCVKVYDATGTGSSVSFSIYVTQ